MVASLLGYGGHLGEVEIRGLLSPVETRLHINLLALQPIHLVWNTFLLSGAGFHRQHHRHMVLQQAGRTGVLGPVPRGAAPLELAGASGCLPGCEPPSRIF